MISASGTTSEYRFTSLPTAADRQGAKPPAVRRATLRIGDASDIGAALFSFSGAGTAGRGPAPGPNLGGRGGRIARRCPPTRFPPTRLVCGHVAAAGRTAGGVGGSGATDDEVDRRFAELTAGLADAVGIEVPSDEAPSPGDVGSAGLTAPDE